MKELSVEEKAKRYDEALIRGSKLWESDMITRENYEYIFPEVKESENIKIIKAIKYGLDHVFTNNTTVFEVTKEQCLAWLEKQCEHDNFRNKIQTGDKVTRNQDGMLVNLSQLNRVAKKQGKNNMGISEATKQKLEDNLHKALEKETPESWNEFLEKQDEYKPNPCDECININGCINCENGELKETEQKPAWSEEDEDILNTIINHFKVDVECTDEDDMVRWLKSLKDRVQPKQEWSEEDKKILESCCGAIAAADYYTYDDKQEMESWLKSLRPQSAWKPSDNELEVLRLAAEKDGTCLMGLYEQLKKLRDE